MYYRMSIKFVIYRKITVTENKNKQIYKVVLDHAERSISCDSLGNAFCLAEI